MLTARQAQQERWDTHIDFWVRVISVFVDTLTTEACKYQLLLASPSTQTAQWEEHVSLLVSQGDDDDSDGGNTSSTGGSSGSSCSTV